MAIENWLTPHWVWLLLAYPLWQAAEGCPWLFACAAGTALLMAVGAAVLLVLRELSIASRLLSGS